MYVCFFAQNERLLRLVNQQISEASYYFFNHIQTIGKYIASWINRNPFQNYGGT